MLPTDRELERAFWDKALNGDAGFAIAFAVLRCAHALRDLGFGNDPGRIPGTTERIAIELQDLRYAVEEIRDHITKDA